jgi:hypothetical protein
VYTFRCVIKHNLLDMLGDPRRLVYFYFHCLAFIRRPVVYFYSATYTERVEFMGKVRPGVGRRS